MNKIRISSIYTYEDWERCNYFLKDSFFKQSDFIPMENLKQIRLESEIIGSFSFKEKNDTVVINHLSIKENLRGNGLGSKTLKRIKKYFKYKKKKEIHFICEENLKRFYTKNGINLKKKNDKYYEGKVLLYQKLTSRIKNDIKNNGKRIRKIKRNNKKN